MAFAPDDLTSDKFLDGRLIINQPRNGYRAGVDPVLLAACVPAKPGQSVLELGCGAGVASMCLGWRVRGLVQFGVELQADYAQLARQNAGQNKIELQVFDGDLKKLPAQLREISFDHVIANPPYFQRNRGSSAADPGRDIALAGQTPLVDWIDTATRRLRPGGYMTVIQRSERLGDVLRAVDERMGSVRVQPLAPRIGRAAELVIVQARKGGRGAMKLAAPIVLHVGERHLSDGESYTAEIRAVLREGAEILISG